jgi:hypothetical protein
MHAWTFRETSIDIVLNTVVDEIVLGFVENIVQNVSYLRWELRSFFPCPQTGPTLPA